MTGLAHKDTEEARIGLRLDACTDADMLIASLGAAGAERFDSVRWHYLETLAKRATAYQGSARRMLDAKLVHALATFKERFEQARCQTNDIVMQSMQHYPHAAADLQRLFNSGDFKEVQRLVARLKAGEHGASMRALVNRITQHAPATSAAHQPENTATRIELKTLRESRNIWAKLSVDKQVSQALAQAPKNAGPINSHMLVLRSLALMRDISPDYLSRFMSYADTLLCLEQGENEKTDKPKKRQGARAARK